MVELFVVIIVGYLANKLGVMDGAFNKRLTNLVLSVTTPCLILSSVLSSDQVYTPAQIGSTMLVAVIGYVLSFVIAMVVTWLMRTPVEQAGILRFMFIFGNVGFIGFPVISTIFGSDALFYAAIFNMPFNLLVYTMGVALIVGKGGDVKLSPKTLLSPCVVASVLALVIALAQLHLPAVFGDVTSLIGQITTPAALLIIGSNLATLPLKGIVGGPRIWVMSAIRLIGSPVLLWLLLRGWVSDPVILGVAVVIQGMPVATNGTMLALQYGGDSAGAGQGTFVSTLFSIITIPLLTLLLT
jgi:hypothetical protein